MACRTGDNVPLDLGSSFTSLISKEIMLFTVNTGRLSTNKSGCRASVFQQSRPIGY
ncbi:MAG: hypothetical protein K6F64_01785 [Clostridia bacterium]|nr:hypothetical protein [Clostridia bacterium]